MKAWGLTPTAWDNLPRGDQAVIIAHEANRAEACQSCGNTLDSKAPFAVVRHECEGCKKLAEVTKNKKATPGIFYAIQRILKP